VNETGFQRGNDRILVYVAVGQAFFGTILGIDRAGDTSFSSKGDFGFALVADLDGL